MFTVVAATYLPPDRSFQDHGDDAITLATVEGDDGYNFYLFVSGEDGEIVATPAQTEV